MGPGRLGDDEGPIVTVREWVGTHGIEYYLLPEHDATGYAVVSDPDGGRMLVDPGYGERVVTTSACGDCATGCTCETTCDFDEPYCECVPDDHFYYPRDREMCLQSEEGRCLCSWCEAVACDCQGGDAPVCPV